MNKQKIVHSDPEIMSGEPVFVGTRVPVQSLFDWLEGGESLDYWLQNFPSVGRGQAVEALRFGFGALVHEETPNPSDSVATQTL